VGKAQRVHGLELTLEILAVFIRKGGQNKFAHIRYSFFALVRVAEDILPQLNAIIKYFFCKVNIKKFTKALQKLNFYAIL
jgi:hypothetical protein